MPEVVVPFNLEVQLLNSSLYAPEIDPETGEPVEPGTHAAGLLAKQIADRIFAQIPRLGRPQVLGKHRLASFDFDGTLIFLIENLDSIAANSLVVGSYHRIFREIALSIEATFQRGWTGAAISIGPSVEYKGRHTEHSLPRLERSISPRDIGILLDVDVSESASIGVQARIPPLDPKNDRPNSNMLASWKSWLPFVVILAGGAWFAVMQETRSRKSEDRVLQAIKNARSQPVQLNNEVIVNLPPREAPVVLDRPSALGDPEDQECIRIIKNGQEVTCK